MTTLQHDKHMHNIQARKSTLKEQADQIRFERALSYKNYHDYGGLGYANHRDEAILLAYIEQLEKEQAAALISKEKRE